MGFQWLELRKVVGDCRKTASGAAHRSGHRMNSECTNKMRAPNEFHFRQSRSSSSVETPGQIIISDVCQANAICLQKHLQAAAAGPEAGPSPVALQ